MRVIDINPNLAIEITVTTEDILADLQYPAGDEGLALGR